MTSYCLLKGRQRDPDHLAKSPKVTAGIWAASPTPEPGLVPCLPSRSPSKAGVPGWSSGPRCSPVPLCQTCTGGNSEMKWANTCQMSISCQPSDAFFENTEPAEVRESLAQEERWAGSRRSCIFSCWGLHFSYWYSRHTGQNKVSPRTHSSSKVLQFLWTYLWLMQESQTLLRKSLKP